MKRFEVFVEGIPASQGSHRIYNNRIVQVNSPKHKAWRKAVVQQSKAALPDDWQPIKGAVTTIIHFYVPRGKTVTRKLPTVPIDCDKLVRAVFDNLTIAGVWEDDSQVIDLVAFKRYAHDKVGAKITVIAIE